MLDLGDFTLPIMLVGREDDGLSFCDVDSVEPSLFLRPRKDNRPPGFFLASGTGDASCLSFSTIRQPGGSTSSGWMS